MENNQHEISHYEISLREIASWQIPSLLSTSGQGPSIQARVPSMQRGAVWQPQQIEMLWDSMMRGFPIGAIVVSEKIERQKDKKPQTQVDGKKFDTTHHILDGQQRTNAITWGYFDPWNTESSDDAILWIDLYPDPEKMKKTTRKFLFRITTKAHPWGFHYGDEAGKLSANQIRAFMELHVEDKSVESSDKRKRPSPIASFPFDANLPIPVYLLFKYFNENNVDWDGLFKEFSKNSNKNQLTNFKSKIESFINDNSAVSNILDGIKILNDTKIIALQVRSDISNIEYFEQIFQRLNRQGTPLDNEELVYSMIKAYWPDVENSISQLNHQVTSEARLIGMAIRVALVDAKEDNKISTERSISQIRELFKPSSNKDSEFDKIKIQEYIKNDLSRTLNWIDKILIIDDDNDYGIPIYLRSSIAWTSKEVFVWLMYLAKRYEYKNIEDRLRKKIIAITLTIHWFGIDKAKTVDYLVKNNDIQKIKISEIKSDNKDLPLIYVPLSVCELDKAIPEIDIQKFEKIKSNSWSFWNLVVNYNENGDVYPSAAQEERKLKYGFFIEKLIRNTELLVYKQRKYIQEEFKDFDPSNKAMWKGYNRPWDYDHILPSNNLNSQGSGYKLYTPACQMWQKSIGNLIAVDFAFNRSAQDQVKASEKYDLNKDKILHGSIGSDIEFFNISHDDTGCLQKSSSFINAARKRFLNIYKDWYNSLDIESIL